jgi:hypothetical protein
MMSIISSSAWICLTPWTPDSLMVKSNSSTAFDVVIRVCSSASSKTARSSTPLKNIRMLLL